MDKLYKIRDLLQKDQNQIRSFKQGGISKAEYQKYSKKISADFLRLISRNGFPYKNIVPGDIYKGGVTLSLHLDLENLVMIFDSYLKSASVNELDNEYRAILIDKIRVLSGAPQLYGTQFKVKEDRKIEILPIEDKNNLEKRRKEMGLKPLNKYLKLIKRKS